MKFATDAIDGVTSQRKVVIGIGELAVSKQREDVIVTHALGSCVAVCIFDPASGVAGMLHFLLPEGNINPDRARKQPGVFADTGIPLLLQTMAQHGFGKRRAVVKLVGGAEMNPAGAAPFSTGRRNVLAAKNLLWRSGMFVSGHDTGGSAARTAYLSVTDGRLTIFTDQTSKEL
jgi:chemotaxis protein CheD